MSNPEELSFTYFPENYRWSHGLLIGLNMAPWGEQKLERSIESDLGSKIAWVTMTRGFENGSARRGQWRRAVANELPMGAR